MVWNFLIVIVWIFGGFFGLSSSEIEIISVIQCQLIYFDEFMCMVVYKQIVLIDNQYLVIGIKMFWFENLVLRSKGVNLCGLEDGVWLKEDGGWLMEDGSLKVDMVCSVFDGFRFYFVFVLDVLFVVFIKYKMKGLQ